MVPRLPLRPLREEALPLLDRKVVIRGIWRRLGGWLPTAPVLLSSAAGSLRSSGAGSLLSAARTRGWTRFLAVGGCASLRTSLLVALAAAAVACACACACAVFS